MIDFSNPFWLFPVPAPKNGRAHRETRRQRGQFMKGAGSFMNSNRLMVKVLADRQTQLVITNIEHRSREATKGLKACL